MSGNTNLSDVISSMRVLCDDKEYGFGTVSYEYDSSSEQIIGMFREAEGQTIIAATEYFKIHGIHFDGPYAKLTIDIHTSLELVGLTASIADALSKARISANVVAGYYHDHIFVQYQHKESAMLAIDSIKNQA